MPRNRFEPGRLHRPNQPSQAKDNPGTNDSPCFPRGTSSSRPRSSTTTAAGPRLAVRGADGVALAARSRPRRPGRRCHHDDRGRNRRHVPRLGSRQGLGALPPSRPLHRLIQRRTAAGRVRRERTGLELGERRPDRPSCRSDHDSSARCGQRVGPWNGAGPHARSCAACRRNTSTAKRSMADAVRCRGPPRATYQAFRAGPRAPQQAPATGAGQQARTPSGLMLTTC